jgi:hypothetical protein
LEEAFNLGKNLRPSNSFLDLPCMISRMVGVGLDPFSDRVLTGLGMHAGSL